LLLESRLIARHKPAYNQHGTRVSSYHYVKLTADPYPRLYATPNLRDDGSLYAGPFRRASFARRVVDALNGAYPLRTCTRLPHAEPPRHGCLRFDIGACLAPCRQPLNGEYTEAVERVRRVLHGDGAELDTLLKRRQDEAVSLLAFEQAARLQAQRETLEQALRTIGRLGAALRDYAVMVYPASQRARVNVYGVAGGRIVAERVLAPATFDRDDALAFVDQVYAADPPRLPLPADTIDEMLLVHGWLRRNREAVNVLTLPARERADGVREAAAAELLARLPLCAGSPAED
jgi:excinuclease ABC subunit C